MADRSPSEPGVSTRSRARRKSDASPHDAMWRSFGLSGHDLLAFPRRWSPEDHVRLNGDTSRCRLSAMRRRCERALGYARSTCGLPTRASFAADLRRGVHGHDAGGALNTGHVPQGGISLSVKLTSGPVDCFSSPTASCSQPYPGIALGAPCSREATC